MWRLPFKVCLIKNFKNFNIKLSRFHVSRTCVGVEARMSHTRWNVFTFALIIRFFFSENNPYESMKLGFVLMSKLACQGAIELRLPWVYFVILRERSRIGNQGAHQHRHPQPQRWTGRRERGGGEIEKVSLRLDQEGDIAVTWRLLI